MRYVLLAAATVMALAGTAAGQDHNNPVYGQNPPRAEAPPLNDYPQGSPPARPLGKRSLVVSAENEVGLHCAVDKESRCASQTTFKGAYSCLYLRRSKLQPDCRDAVNKLSLAIEGRS